MQTPFAICSRRRYFSNAFVNGAFANAFAKFTNAFTNDFQTRHPGIRIKTLWVENDVLGIRLSGYIEVKMHFNIIVNDTRK